MYAIRVTTATICRQRDTVTITWMIKNQTKINPIHDEYLGKLNVHGTKSVNIFRIYGERIHQQP